MRGLALMKALLAYSPIDKNIKKLIVSNKKGTKSYRSSSTGLVRTKNIMIRLAKKTSILSKSGLNKVLKAKD